MKKFINEDEQPLVKTFKTTCKHCGRMFTYQNSDIYDGVKLGIPEISTTKLIKCPSGVCKANIHHESNLI